MRDLREVICEYGDIPLLRNMSGEDVEAALQCVGAYVREYQKEDYIFLENDKVGCVGCILEGSVQMIREDIWGNKTMLITMRDKELFGESFVCGKQETSSVAFVAGEKTLVLFLPFHRVMNSCSCACAHHQKLVMNMVTLIAEKNGALISKIDIISKKTLREKIAAYLLTEAGVRNSGYFTISMGRVQLAEYLNADRSALSRELKLMKEEGYIDFEKNTFRILKEF